MSSNIDPDQYTTKAKALVCDAFNTSFFPEDVTKEVVPEDFYVVWFAKTLGNWKALVSTDVVPGQYFEVTHNGAKQETYVDHYHKVSNRGYSDSSYESLMELNASTSQERIERYEFRSEVLQAAQYAAKNLRDNYNFSNFAIANEMGINVSVVQTLLV